VQWKDGINVDPSSSAKPAGSSYVLIRGLTRGRGHWGDFPSLLKKILRAEDEIIFVDLPGNGETYLQRSPWQMRVAAEFCRDSVLKNKRTHNQVIVVAISMGAMAAVAWMQNFPTEVHQAVLINTSSAAHSFFLHRFQLGSFFGNAKSFFAQDREKAILEITSNHPERRAQFLPELREYSASHPVSPANALRQIASAAFFGFPRQAPLRPEKILILTSTQDRLVKVSCSLAIAKAWHCQISQHPTAGHDLPLDDSQWVADQVQKFIT